MKYISVLGSTGSIGTNTLEVVEKFRDNFSVIGLSAFTNIEKLADQIKKFAPKVVSVRNEDCAMRLEILLGHGSIKPEILFGDSGYIAVATYVDVDVVLNAIVGSNGLIPTLAAIDSGKDIALANKETLVMAGEIVMNKVSKNKVNLMPVDSEHSAIYQCLLGNNKTDLKKILLTASGGPFLDKPRELFSTITVNDALKHPNWSMGKKITVDSATLMNKALEVIEAMWLFDVSIDKVEVLIHPQSIIHSMVSYRDGVVMAQMGIPDMKAAISYALSFPQRFEIGINSLDFFNIGDLSFKPPDLDKFPCLQLAHIASKSGGAMPAVMNAANEIAVQSFLDKQIPFTRIYHVIKETMDSYCQKIVLTVDDIMNADRWARLKAIDLINAKMVQK